MPVVRGALGLMNKELGEITSRISDNINTDEIQTKLETAHILGENTVAEVTFSSVTSEFGPGYSGQIVGTSDASARGDVTNRKYFFCNIFSVSLRICTN